MCSRDESPSPKDDIKSVFRVNERRKEILLYLSLSPTTFPFLDKEEEHKGRSRLLLRGTNEGLRALSRR